jgi:hypothetical protein
MNMNILEPLKPFTRSDVKPQFSSPPKQEHLALVSQSPLPIDEEEPSSPVREDETQGKLLFVGQPSNSPFLPYYGTKLGSWTWVLIDCRKGVCVVDLFEFSAGARAFESLGIKTTLKEKSST